MVCECECIVLYVLDGMYVGVDNSDGRHAGWAHEILLVEMSSMFVDVDDDRPVCVVVDVDPLDCCRRWCCRVRVGMVGDANCRQGMPCGMMAMKNG